MPTRDRDPGGTSTSRRPVRPRDPEWRTKDMVSRGIFAGTYRRRGAPRRPFGAMMCRRIPSALEPHRNDAREGPAAGGRAAVRAPILVGAIESMSLPLHCVTGPWSQAADRTGGGDARGTGHGTNGRRDGAKTTAYVGACWFGHPRVDCGCALHLDRLATRGHALLDSVSKTRPHGHVRGSAARLAHHEADASSGNELLEFPKVWPEAIEPGSDRALRATDAVSKTVVANP